MARMNHAVNDRNRVKKPESFRDMPRYLRELCATFFTRLFCIFRLVWEARPSLLFWMLFMSVVNGITPVIGSLIAAGILNRMADVYAGAPLAFAAISVMLVWQFVYTLLKGAITQLYSVVTSVSGELVANHVKIRIMEKAKTLDLVRFDDPDFYAELENASREAGSRPIQVMNSTFTVLSTLISMLSFTAVLFAVSPAAPLLILLVAVPTAVISFVFRKKNVNYMFRRSRSRREMEYYSETLVNKDLVKEVRMFSLADTLIGKYKASFADYFRGLKKL